MAVQISRTFLLLHNSLWLLFLIMILLIYGDIFYVQMKELVRHTEATLGPVDIIVNNAGIMCYGLMKNLNEEEWERQVDINCKVRRKAHWK